MTWPTVLGILFALGCTKHSPDALEQKKEPGFYIIEQRTRLNFLEYKWKIPKEMVDAIYRSGVHCEDKKDI